LHGKRGIVLGLNIPNYDDWGCVTSICHSYHRLLCLRTSLWTLTCLPRCIG